MTMTNNHRMLRFGQLLFALSLVEQFFPARGTTAGVQVSTVENYGMIAATGFDNSYYQAYQYLGSRILEHGSVAYREFNWTQTGDIQTSTGFVYMVDPTYHVVIELAPNVTRGHNDCFTSQAATKTGCTFPGNPFPKNLNIPWASQYRVISGIYGRQGYFDGIYEKSLFNGPMGISIGSQGIYIADTNNHALRFLNFAAEAVNRRVMTLTGHPSRPGEQDGPAMYSRLRFPSSVGNYQDQKVFVLDNHARVRMYRRLEQDVITLVDGACRAIRKRMYPIRIIVREVGCHDVWSVHQTGSVETALFKPAVQCSGHAGTCAPRHHPGYSDLQAPNLLTVEESRPQITGRRGLAAGDVQQVQGGLAVAQNETHTWYLDKSGKLKPRFGVANWTEMQIFRSGREDPTQLPASALLPSAGERNKPGALELDAWRFSTSFNPLSTDNALLGDARQPSAKRAATESLATGLVASSPASAVRTSPSKTDPSPGARGLQAKSDPTAAQDVPSAKANASARAVVQRNTSADAPGNKPRGLSFGDDSTMMKDQARRRLARPVGEKVKATEVYKSRQAKSTRSGALEHWKHLRSLWNWVSGKTK